MKCLLVLLRMHAWGIFLIKYIPKLVTISAHKTVANLSLLLGKVYEKSGGCAPGTSSSVVLSWIYLFI